MVKKSSTFFQKKKYLIFIFVVVVAFVGAILLKIGLVSWIGIEKKNTVSPTPSSYNAVFFPPTTPPELDKDGLFTGNYKNLQFKYSVGWTFQTPELSGELTLRLSKDDHFIISGRRDIGGSQCVYSDTKTEDILPWAEGVKPISDFTELSFGSRVFRRSKIITSSGFFTEKENRTVFSFCQKEPSGVFGSFAFGETFYYDVPENYDENLLKEMDDIVLSAKEISKGEFCGGIAGIQCPSGYSCVLDGNYPDAGGACQKSIK